MNTINEMCLAWYMWVNGNYDILIMTITLIVVAGLVLEVVRLNRKVVILENELLNFDETQRVVNRLIAEDMIRIDKKINQLKMTTDAWGIKTPKKK